MLKNKLEIKLMDGSVLLKILHTIRYYKPEQLYWYTYYRIRKLLPVRFWFREKPLPKLEINKEPLNNYGQYARSWASVENNLETQAKDILKGIWTYAGEAIPLILLLENKHKNLSPLALYGFHTFEFLWKLCLAHLQSPDKKYADFAKNFMKQWIKEYLPGTSVAWDPYPTSYRIRYWILAMHIWQWNDKEILTSLAVQTKYLSQSLEYHLKGNHLIQNLCGLIISSATLFPIHLPEFLQQLEKELNEQILDDGGHYEQVPMYHLHVFLDLITVLAILKNPPEFLIKTVSKMSNFLSGLVLSDGELPLLGDTVHGHLPSPEKVLHITSKYIPAIKENTSLKKEHDFPQSGYYLYKSNNTPCFNMVIRAGKTGSPFQLAHAHCDQLSYELLIEKQRVIVDSGIHGYAGSPYRAFQRSTRAHNTVYIEGEEQLECWSTFRVARRGRTLWTMWEPYEEGFLFAGKFQYFTGTVHLRGIYIQPKKGFLCCDWIKTHKRKTVCNLLHLHPEVEVKVTNSFVLLQCGKINISLYPVKNEIIEMVAANQSPLQGWYSEFFGTVSPNPVIILKNTSATHTLTQTGYWISFSDEETKYSKGNIEQWVEEIGKKILKQML